MAAAILCQLCQSIPLHDLPELPRGYSGMAALFGGLGVLDGRPEYGGCIDTLGIDPWDGPVGFPHHPDLESLRRSSAAGCDLCRELGREADTLRANVEKRNVESPDMQSAYGDPTFDLWVTKRSPYGDGFWVWTKSSVAAEMVLFVVATYGFCAEDNDSPLASMFLGRPINGPPDSSTLDRVAGWVTACDSHGTCLSPDSSLPTRLIDVGGSGPETTVKLVEPEAGSKGRYTAVSYCWGVKSNSYSTTSRSLAGAREVGMNLGDLPRTFQDAIAVTRKLGVRYIWIDSLCICQDDVKDWEREASRMAAVYSNAYLTIAATGSSDAGGGLFFDRPGRSYLRTAFRSTNGAIEGDVLIFPLAKGLELQQSDLPKMHRNPLSHRGWAFQERVLARRVLHFAADQISLECLQGTLFEDGLRLPFRYYSIHRRPDHIDTKAGMRDQWRKMVSLYSDRKLTFASDKLPALSGVAKAFADMLGDEYLAGTWSGSMMEDLCWHPNKIPNGLAVKTDNYRAPSWSWASVDMGVVIKNWGPARNVATLLDHHIEIDGDNPFGNLKSGWIKIEAPLIPLCVSDEPSWDGWIALETGSAKGSNAFFDKFSSAYSTSAEVVRQMKLFAVVLTAILTKSETEDEGDAEIDAQGYSCIVVTPVDGSDDRVRNTPELMKRVGSMDFLTSFNPGKTLLFVESSRATVTLV